MIKLRPYQTATIDAIKKDWGSGLTDVMITMATGGGKSAIFLSLLNETLKPGERGLILAHRLELIDQGHDRMLDYYPEWVGKIGITMGAQNETDKQITVATVQTLASERRLRELLAHGPIDYLIVDECHHNSLNNHSYNDTIQTLKSVNPNMKHLGVTATPIRADGDGIGGVYQKESAHYGIVELIKMGYLVPVRWLAIQVGISVAGVKTQAGDFQAKSLAEVFETDNCFELVVETHKKYAANRQAIAFTVSVDGAYDLAAKFNEAGIKAAAADGTTDKKVRQGILDDFRQGKLQVICNVGLWTEGLDVPEVSCIHQVRPTKSDGLYTQIIGRSLRTFPGKEDALILDYAPIEVRNIAMAGDVLGVPLRKDSYIEQTEETELGEVIGGFTFDGKVKWLEGNPADIISRQLDYLDLTPWRWYRESGWMSLGLGKGKDEIERSLVIAPPSDGKVKLYLVAKRPESFGWRAYLAQTDELDAVLKWSDDYADKRGDAILAIKNKKWQKSSPTDPQIAFAKRLKGCWKKDANHSRGELAQRITHFLAIGAVKDLEEKGIE
jgi:superfamily II DNA or RNA helicase